MTTSKSPVSVELPRQEAALCRFRPGIAPLGLPPMQLDDLLQRYFASTDLSAISPETLAAGVEHCRVDFGLEQDRGTRFALWALLHMLDSAPDLDVAFASEEDREAARNLMDLLSASKDERGT